MNYNIEIDSKGTASFKLNLFDVIHGIDNTELRRDLIESLACADDVINEVVNMLIDGYTTNGFSGGWSISNNTPLQKAKRLIAENSSHAVKKTIEDLQSKIASLESDVKYWREECQKPRF